MSLAIAHLGPPGTYTEEAALAYAKWLTATQEVTVTLCPYSSNAQTLRSTAAGETQIAVAPVENSVEGSVAVTLDTLWQLDQLQIQQALVLPIVHALISTASNLTQLKAIYSHPQALGQCQKWLEQFLPQVQLIPSNSNTEALVHLKDDPTLGAIASQRAAQLYQLPVLACPINDYADNCTRFWVVRLKNGSIDQPQLLTNGTYTSLAFSVPANVPGALVKPLQIFADRQINLSRIESRPSKRSLGDYIFFVDLESPLGSTAVQSVLAEIRPHTEILKVLGSYSILTI